MDNIYFYYLIGFLILASLIGIFFYKMQRNFKYQMIFVLITYAATMLTLSFLLPSTPSIATSYPMTVTDLDSQQKILQHLQMYNKAIVATSQIFQTMIYVTVFWLLPALLTLVYNVKLDKKRQPKIAVQEIQNS